MKRTLRGSVQEELDMECTLRKAAEFSKKLSGLTASLFRVKCGVKIGRFP
jgi:hypothetical protein